MSEDTFVLQIVKTAIICCNFILVGGGLSLLGPTTLDLQLLIKATTHQASYLMPLRGIGYGVGSILGGFIVNRVSVRIVASYSLLLSTLFHFIAPLARSLWVLLLAIFGIGMALSQLEIASNLWIIEIWGPSGSKLAHVGYFFFGLGAFLAPMLSEPFLAPVLPDNSTSPIPVDDLQIKWPYFLFAGYSLLNASLVMMEAFRNCKKQSNQTETMLEESKEEDKMSRISWQRKALVLIVTFAFAIIGVGMDFSYGLVLLGYAVKSDVKMNKSQGAYLTAVYWATYTFGRVFALLLVNRVSNRVLMHLHMALALGAAFYQYLFYPSHLSTWISAILMGIGLSSMLPIHFAYIQEYTRLVGSLTSVTLLAACTGEAIFPFSLEYLLNVYAKGFVYFNLALFILSFFLFRLMEMTYRSTFKKSSNEPITATTEF